MNTGVLPVGNHYGTVDELMAQLPAGGATLPSVDAYGIPAVGTPENAQMAQMMAPSSTVQLDPEEMEALKWQNWATTQGFEALGPRAQREMANMYHTNVLPYVASSLGQDAATLQNEFVTNFPQVGRLIGIEPSTIQGRYEDVQAYGESLTDPQRNQVIFGGTLPATSTANNKTEADMLAREDMVGRLRDQGALSGVSEDAIAQYILTNDPDFLKSGAVSTVGADGELVSPEVAERRRIIEEAGGLTQFEPQQIAAFEATGHPSHLSASATATARKNNAEILQKSEQFVSSAENALGKVRNEVDTVNRAIEYLGDDGEGNYVPRGIFPIAGPFGALVAKTPLNTSASSVRGLMQSVEAQAAFNALKALRESSTDGSSGLGQVTEREIGLLVSEWDAIDVNELDDRELHKSLTNVRKRLQSVVEKLETDVNNRKALVAAGLLHTVLPGARRPDPVPAADPVPDAGTPAPAPAVTPAPSGQVIELTPEEATELFGDL